VARENAREGCVHETFGALTAVRQARLAADAGLRATFATIARDETRHARLAWEIDAWARTALPTRAARLVDEARREAGARLVADVGRIPTPRALVRELGLPTAAAARALARRASRSLWAA
jgi:hypothetical protein